MGATPLDMEKVYHSETRELYKDIFPSVRKRETQNQQNFSVTKKYNNIREGSRTAGSLHYVEPGKAGRGSEG